MGAIGMATLLGPVLRLRGQDHQNNVWRISALVCVEEGSAPPTLSFLVGGIDYVAPSIQLWAIRGAESYRFDLDIPLADQAQVLRYWVSASDEEWTVQIPARQHQPVFAFGSCNGYSSLKLKKSVDDSDALWKHMALRHQAVGYNALLLGGDQVYSDAMWELITELEDWNDRLWDDPLKVVIPEGLAEKLLNHFFIEMYCRRWSQAPVRAILAQIPTIMMWDDHDIMDGWGSYKEAWAQNPVYRLIFETASRCFELFQLHGSMADPVFIPGRAAGYSQLYHFSGVSLLVPDLRAERRLDQVISPATWKAIYSKLESPPTDPDRATIPCKHLLVMSSIPVMHARFGQIESILGWTPGQQELEDDLHDHWSSRPHRGERVRLIHRLLEYSRRENVRVTILSGDVHVAAHATIYSSREGEPSTKHTLVQLTSSGIVHPAPPAIMRFALNTLFDDDEEIDQGIVGRMEKMPGDERRYVASRNWLSLERDDPQRSLGRLWANWFAEEDVEHPFTRVIHPIG